MEQTGTINNVLIIGAHFDDAELGCGGTMAKLVSQGKRVYKLTLTDNVTDYKQKNIFVNFEDSLSDSAKACEVLGVEEITDFNFAPCNHLAYSAEFMQQIESVIFEKNIDTVFIHFKSDLNQDHIAAFQLSITAARHCKNIFCFHSNGYTSDEPFYPTVFFDISEFVQVKREALNQYSSEHNRFNRLFETSFDRASVWGYALNVDYAEGFVPIKICF